MQGHQQTLRSKDHSQPLHLTVGVANVTLGTQPVRAQVTAQQNPIGKTAQPDASDQFIAHMGTYSKHTKLCQKDH